MTEKGKQEMKDSFLKIAKVVATLLGIGTIMVAVLAYVIESHEMATRAESGMVQKADKKDLDQVRDDVKELKVRQDKIYDEVFGNHNDVTVRHFKQNHVKRYSDTDK